MKVGEAVRKQRERRRSGKSRMAIGVFLALLLLFSCYPVFPVTAASSGFSAVLTEPEGRVGDTFEISAAYDGSQGPVGAFFLSLEFDPDVLEYVRTTEQPGLWDAYSTTAAEEGRVKSVCTMKRPEEALTGPAEPFSYVFRVKETAEPGETALFFSLYDAAGPDGGHLTGCEETLTYTVLPPYSKDAFLLSLTPETGTLEPAFSPDRLSYTLSVPFEITSLTFKAEPVEGAVCKVNRKNLGAGGSDTAFLFTVTAEDLETKAVYRVTVHRESKATPVPTATPTPKPTKTPRPTATPKPAKTGGSAASSSSAPQGNNGKKSPSPSETPVLAGTASQAEPSPSASPAQELPTLIIRSEEFPVLPAVLAFLAFVLVALFSEPLSKWISEKLFGKKDK